MAPGDVAYDQRTSSSMSVQRPWPIRTPSSDSISTTSSMPTSPNSSHQSLRKRHSNYMRKPERSTSPIPELPPQRPPRNPARPNSVYPSITSRPSTATSSKEWATPWEPQPAHGAEETGRPRARSGAPSVRSKASSAGLGGVSTGPVEDVTPWELYPVPASIPSTKPPSTSSSAVYPHSPPASSPRISAQTKATGLVEDVTPWELYPEPPSTANGKQVLVDVVSKIAPPPRSPSLFAPPRSKPPSIISNSSLQVNRMPTATGPTEEVTPWELEEPPPTEEDPPRKLKASQQRLSMTMSKAQLEEVMPWELYPAPPVPALDGSEAPASSRNGTTSNRPSISSHKPMGEFSLRRRRSTGSRPSKIRSNVQQPPSKTPSRISSSQAVSNNSSHGSGLQPSSSNTPASIISHTSSIPSADNQGSIQPSPAPSFQRKHSDVSSKQQQKNSQFSTADRTILEELKRNISARNAQFVQKGVGVHLTDGTVSAGKRHHPYSRREVPYPRSYDRDVVDLDVWETLFCQDICESLTWHVFEKPPLKVLDIGCGTGTWILNCARTWRETRFVGLDIVPLHPDLQQVGNGDYASRITWVQHNFLEGLPFPNDEFDFVHIKRIALGVPEDKWDALFDEISRVMKPGAAFEMVEEDLFFPGKLVDPEDEDADLASPLSRSSSVASTTGRSSLQLQRDKPLNGLASLQDPAMAATPTPSSAFPKSLSRPSSIDFSRRGSLSQEANTEQKGRNSSTTPPGSPRGYVTLIPPHSRSTARPTLYVRTTSNGQSPFASTSPPKSHNSSLLNASAVSLISSLHHHSESDNHLLRKRRSSINLPSHDSSGIGLGLTDTPIQPMSGISLGNPLTDGPPSSSKLPPPFLLRTPAKAPTNPRDHSLLEYIYDETLSSRFINTTPLSLLNTYLEYHFKDARSHPPLQFTFPPVPVKPAAEFDSATEDEEDHEFPPSAKQASPVRSNSSRKSVSSVHRGAFSNENGEVAEGHRWLSMQGLLEQSSPYVSLDSSRAYAYTPAKKSHFTYARGKDKAGRVRRQSRLPNKTLNIDLRTLNLHLALRAKEVLGCAESMWEWVLEAQKAWKNEKEAQRRSGARGHSLELNHPYQQQNVSQGGVRDHKTIVREMTREDFNQLLLNFEMDMQDQASLNTALKERFQWNVIDSVPPQNRKIFNTACEKYDKWFQRETRGSFSSSTHRPSRNSLHAPSSINVTAPTPDTPFPNSATSAVKTRGRSNSHSILMNRGANGSSSTNGFVPPLPMSSAKSDASVHFALPSSAVSPAPHPTQRLSRSVCVFVAWKQEETPYPTQS